MNYRGLKIAFVIFFCLSSIFFFYPVWIPGNILYYIYYAFLFTTALLIIINLNRYQANMFTTPILMLIIAILISVFAAKISWSQKLLDTFIATLRNLSYILFFLLVIFKLRVQDIEKIIIIMGALYIVVYLITYFFYPTPTFSHGRLYWGSSRGFLRILMGGVDYMYIFGFYSLNQYFNTRKAGWLIVYFTTIILVIMTLTRMVIVSFFLLSAWYILRKSNYFYKIIAMLLIVGFIVIISKMEFSKIMINQTISHTTDFRNYVRVQAADFYIHDFSPDIFARIFGNGIPKTGSKYWRYVWDIQWEYGFYTSDIGYVGLYVKFGILAVIAFVIIIYKTITTSIPQEYLYSKLSLYLIFILSIMGDVPFYQGAGPMITLLIYVLYLKNLSRKTVNSSQSLIAE